MTNSSNVYCPRCLSKNLIKYGSDHNDNQKYQCQDCGRQFAPETLKKSGYLDPSNYKYQPCPVCGKATFLHHDYEYYYNLRCCDKICNHSFNLPKSKEIKPLPQNINLPGKTNFKGMRHAPHLIVMALYHYFHHQSSTRKVSTYLKDFYNVKVTHVTISDWVKKFAPLFKLKSEKILPDNLNHSDEWHVDETVVKIKGQKYYLWAIIDSETRFVLSYNLSPYRSPKPAFELFKSVKMKFGQPKAIVSDRYPSYNIPTNMTFNLSNHIKVQSFKDDVSNNLIESFFGTFKDWYNGRKGFKSYTSANQLISVFIFFYNFVRSHSELNELTPAQVAGCNYSDQERKSWLIAA